MKAKWIFTDALKSGTKKFKKEKQFKFLFSSSISVAHLFRCVILEKKKKSCIDFVWNSYFGFAFRWMNESNIYALYHWKKELVLCVIYFFSLYISVGFVINGLKLYVSSKDTRCYYFLQKSGKALTALKRSYQDSFMLRAKLFFFFFNT